MALKALADGFVSVGRGMNESVEPVFLRNNEVARAVNVELTSGIAKTRNGFRVIDLWTDTPEWNDAEGNAVDPLTYFKDGKFQGATRYRFQNQDFLVVVAGQLLWRINIGTRELELYGWSAEINDIPHVNMLTPRCWFCQVEQFMIVQDGINTPWIIHGRAIRRSRGADIRGEVGVDAQNINTTEGSVTVVNPDDNGEGFRVKVQLSAVVDNLVVGDYCTVRFRDESIVETGVITKMDKFSVPNTYEIKFETSRNWVTYGMKRFDNAGALTIYHGMVSVGRLETPEVPAGTVMAYGHGRIFTVWAGRYIVAGDILKPWEPESVLKFLELGYVSGGSTLGVPAEMGDIVNMTFLQNASSGTGQGSLIVFCERGVSSFAVQTPRSQWLDVDISNVLFTSNGAVGAYAVEPVNNDLMFLSSDGLRSLKHTVSTVAGNSIIFENRSLSENISQVWDESAEWAWKYSSITHVGNKVFFLTKADGGYKLENIPRDQNLGGLDDVREPIEEVRFKAVCSMSPIGVDDGREIMVFNGIWTGYEFLQVLSGTLDGKVQPLILARDINGDMQLLSVSNTPGDDNDSNSVCRIYTGAYDFLSGMEDRVGDTLGKILLSKSLLKRFEYMDIWVSGIYGKVTVKLFVRPVGYPSWVKCGEFDVEAATSDVERRNAWPQFRRKQRITAPRLQCDPVTTWDLMTASQFQFCLEWTGGLTIDRALFFATLLPEEKNFACVQPQGNLMSATGFNDYDYVVGAE